MKPTHNKLVQEVRTRTGLSLKDTTDTLACFLDVIADHLIDGDQVNLKRIGSLRVVASAPRHGVTPGGTAYSTHERNTIKFKPSTPLKEAIQA